MVSDFWKGVSDCDPSLVPGASLVVCVVAPPCDRSVSCQQPTRRHGDGRIPGINSDSETIFRRFRNQISAIPQPKSDTLPQPKKGASATKNNRFRNQKKTIPQPKKGDSATKTRGFRNQKKAIPQPPSARLRNQHPRQNCGHSQHSIVSRCRGWGGVG